METVEADPDLKADITSTFRDTLNLDPRYNVIANVLAHQAHEHGMDLRLSDVALREECLAYWPVGFAGLDVEGFRAYLQEMVGLGVLAPNNDGRGWHLRSPNVLRMIGSRDDVTAELVHAESEAVPSEFIALSTRRLLPDGRTRSPLTAAQVDDLLGDHANQVRVVLGSAAVGVENVATTLRAVCADLGERYDLVEPRGRKPFEDALLAGAQGRRRLVLSDLVAMAAKDDACTQALTMALRNRPTSPGVTRSVVIVVGTDQLRFWRVGTRRRRAIRVRRRDTAPPRPPVAASVDAGHGTVLRRRSAGSLARRHRRMAEPCRAGRGAGGRARVRGHGSRRVGKVPCDRQRGGRAPRRHRHHLRCGHRYRVRRSHAGDRRARGDARRPCSRQSRSTASTQTHREPSPLSRRSGFST